MSDSGSSCLNGRQEHYLKRELISQQVNREIKELNSPTALRHFGAPFRANDSSPTPVSAAESSLPILRYVFANHVRNFPFLDQAKEEEFWQDKVQVFLEAFASKHVSSSEDRQEETKRRKIAVKSAKLLELMMGTGIATSSGYEEEIRFSDIEIVERGANDVGLLVNAPNAVAINGWDVNVAGVRTVTTKRLMKTYRHAQFTIAVNRGFHTIYVGRRYGDFVQLFRNLQAEFPGKTLPPLPRKNKASSFLSPDFFSDDDEENDGNHAVDSAESPPSDVSNTNQSAYSAQRPQSLLAPPSNRRSRSSSSRMSVFSTRSSRGRESSFWNPASQFRSNSITSNQSSESAASNLSSVAGDPSSSASASSSSKPLKLPRENQRVSLRAFLRTLLQNPNFASSKAVGNFLTHNPLPPSLFTDEEQLDMIYRHQADQKQYEKQKRFYHLAQQRARELDIYMERFRKSIVEGDGLRRLFDEFKTRESIEQLSPEYQKFVEWFRITIAATIYHIFLAEENSQDMFSQARRIHSLIPYPLLKDVIAVANPAVVMSGVLKLFLYRPLGTRSLLQRVFGSAMGDGIRNLQSEITELVKRISEPPTPERSGSSNGETSPRSHSHSQPDKNNTVYPLIRRLHAFVQSEESVKQRVRNEASATGTDAIIVIARLDADVLLDGYAAWMKLGSSASDVVNPNSKAGGWFSRVSHSPPDVRHLKMPETLADRLNNASMASMAFKNEFVTDDDCFNVLQADAVWFSWLKDLLKKLIRQRDKAVMMDMIEELPVTMTLFQDLFHIFYEPIVRVYKSANVYNSITDWANFVNDALAVIDRAQRRQDPAAADPNETVQQFIDVCSRHQDKFYKFLHEVCAHDNVLIPKGLQWVEEILGFVRNGPRGSGNKSVDMNGLFEAAVADGTVERETCMAEIDALMRWHEARKHWHYRKTKQKLAGGDNSNSNMLDQSTSIERRSSTSHLPAAACSMESISENLRGVDLETSSVVPSDGGGGGGSGDVDSVVSSDEENALDDTKDPILLEQRKQARKQEREKLRGEAGEPRKPDTPEVHKLLPTFTNLLREILATD